MSNPNEMQVGGAHYAGEYQHWDWAIDNRLGYLEAAASKYVTRHKKKNGLQDLEKSHHYVSKAIEAANAGRYFNNVEVPSHKRFANTTLFVNSAGLDYQQTSLCHLLSDWNDSADLHIALNILHEYMRPLVEAAEVAVTLAAPTLAQPSGKATPAPPAAGQAPRTGSMGMAHPFGYDGD